MRLTASVRICAIFLLALLAASPLLAAEPKSLTPVQAQALLARDKKVLLLDVRTPQEYRQGHLRGAVLIPLAEVEGRLGEIPRDRPVLVYCAVGARSATAAGFLTRHGYREVYQMSDGLVGWYKSGLPIEK